MMRALFLACRQLCPHLVERVRALVSLLIKVLMPSWGSTLITSFKSNYLAKAPPPNTFPLMRFQLVHFGGHKHSVYNTHIHQAIAKIHCVLSTRNIQVKDMFLLREFPDEQLRAMGTASFNLAQFVSFLSSAGGQGRRHCHASSPEICRAGDIDSETLSSCLLAKAPEMYW